MPESWDCVVFGKRMSVVRNSKNIKSVEYMLDKGLSIDSENDRGQTALDYAYNKNIKNFLIEKGVKFGSCKK